MFLFFFFFLINEPQFVFSSVVRLPGFVLLLLSSLGSQAQQSAGLLYSSDECISSDHLKGTTSLFSKCLHLLTAAEQIQSCTVPLVSFLMLTLQHLFEREGKNCFFTDKVKASDFPKCLLRGLKRSTLKRSTNTILYLIQQGYSLIDDADRDTLCS